MKKRPNRVRRLYKIYQTGSLMGGNYNRIILLHQLYKSNSIIEKSMIIIVNEDSDSITITEERREMTIITMLIRIKISDAKKGKQISTLRPLFHHASQNAAINTQYFLKSSHG